MSDRSKIEWTDATWNPVRGCKKISPGCKYCYAETFAERWRGVPDHPYEEGFTPRLVEDKLSDPLSWVRPRRVFVNSMSDLFQDFVPQWFIQQVFEVMALADWHIYQVLTKRADRMQQAVNLLPDRLQSMRHVWLGVSVEDRKYGLPRIESLRKTPASLRFLSIEPLLEDLGSFDLSGVGWVIVGGESGPGARPMQPEWATSIRELCHQARPRVPFFFKQWGGVQKSRTGRTLEGREYNEVPSATSNHPPDRLDRLARRELLELRLDTVA